MRTHHGRDAPFLRRPQRAAALIAWLLAAALLGGCNESPPDGERKGQGGGGITGGEPAPVARSLEQILASGRLRVLTRNAPTTWYVDRDGEPAGPEHDLVTAFAASLGLEVEFLVAETIDEILARLEAGDADLAAAGLTVTDARRPRFRFGPSYQSVTQQVVCRRDTAQPESLEELAGLDLVVIASSSYSERLAELKAGGHPGLRWRETAEHDTEALLRQVWSREIDCTVADSTIVDINRRYMPELIAPLNLSRDQNLAWAFPREAEALARAVGEWQTEFESHGGLARVRERYYGFYAEFDYVDIARYVRRIDQRFPRYRAYFQEAAEQYGLDYTLVAAQGYQESHWVANAKSPTGVRGIMMLTLPTARAMGVTNRLDPRQSIFGGARYLAKLKTRFDEAVQEPDRTWLALAAYNVGRGHLHDAQVLARERGLSPHRWADVKEVLPLLADKRFYARLKYGYARGHEPVRYVQRIREYQQVLVSQLAVDVARSRVGGGEPRPPAAEGAQAARSKLRSSPVSTASPGSRVPAPSPRGQGSPTTCRHGASGKCSEGSGEPAWACQPLPRYWALKPRTSSCTRRVASLS